MLCFGLINSVLLKLLCVWIFFFFFFFFKNASNHFCLRLSLTDLFYVKNSHVYSQV